MKRLAGHAVQQRVRHRHGACRPAQDRDLWIAFTPQQGGDLCRSVLREHVAGLHQALSPALDDAFARDPLLFEPAHWLARAGGKHQPRCLEAMRVAGCIRDA